jgi:hypothetical protein
VVWRRRGEDAGIRARAQNSLSGDKAAQRSHGSDLDMEIKPVCHRKIQEFQEGNLPRVGSWMNECDFKGDGYSIMKDRSVLGWELKGCK